VKDPNTTKSDTTTPEATAREHNGSPGVNVVLLRGRLSRPAELRVLPSGDRLVAMEVSVNRQGQKTEGVPVVWHEAPAAAETLDVDQAVVVLGRVRRRFFRAGGYTQSRTEVVAEGVVPTRQAKRARALVGKAVACLEEAELEWG
jgi:single-strand DNA-binding protein